MNRRSFLRMLGAGVVAPVVSLPVRKYVFAPAGGWRPDPLNLKNWYGSSLQQVELYEVAGQTIFPVFGVSGALVAEVVSFVCERNHWQPYITRLEQWKECGPGRLSGAERLGIAMKEHPELIYNQQLFRRADKFEVN